MRSVTGPAGVLAGLCVGVAAGDGDVVVVHCVKEMLECRPFSRRLLPTSQHYVVHLASTAWWRWVAPASLQLLKNLMIINLYTRQQHPALIETHR